MQLNGCAARHKDFVSHARVRAHSELDVPTARLVFMNRIHAWHEHCASPWRTPPHAALCIRMEVPEPDPGKPPAPSPSPDIPEPGPEPPLPSPERPPLTDPEPPPVPIGDPLGSPPVPQAFI
jgi:hypothetical protein